MYLTKSIRVVITIGRVITLYLSSALMLTYKFPVYVVAVSEFRAALCTTLSHGLLTAHELN